MTTWGKHGLCLLAGLLFGVGLALSGMTNPARVIGFLDITSGQWDPTLAFVMGGALSVFAVGAWVLRRKVSRFPSGGSGPVDSSLVWGAVLFGLGWGLAGFCPGPALANLGALRSEAVIFVVTMSIGMLIAQRGFGADSPK